MAELPWRLFVNYMSKDMNHEAKNTQSNTKFFMILGGFVV